MNEALKKLNENQQKMAQEILKLKAMMMDLEKLRKDVRGLISLIPDEKLDAFELGREDEAFEKSVDKKMEQPTLEV